MPSLWLPGIFVLRRSSLGRLIAKIYLSLIAGHELGCKGTYQTLFKVKAIEKFHAELQRKIKTSDICNQEK
jgi:hypothetical protein